MQYRPKGIKLGTIISYAKDKKFIPSVQKLRPEGESESVTEGSVTLTGSVVDSLYKETEGETRELGVVRFIMEAYKDKLKYCNKKIWARIYSHEWTCEPDLIKDQLYRWISDNYPGFPINKYNNVYILFKTKMYIHHDNQFEEKLRKSSRGKLCFENGVLDIRTGKLTKWDSPETNEIYTLIMIGYSYTKGDENAKKEIWD